MEHNAENRGREEDKKLHVLSFVAYVSNTAFDRRVCLSAKSVTFLIIVQILFLISFPQEAQTQETIAREISDLATRLGSVEEKLISIDNELASLKRERNIANSRLSALKAEEARPKGFWGSLPGMGTLRRRKIGRLFTRIQELADEMGGLQERRKPLIRQFVVLADQLIEQSSSRITILGEAFLGRDYATQEEAEKQLSELSALWGLVEKTRASKDKYTPGTIEPEDEWSFPTLLSDDPAELRLMAATLKDAAAEERDKVIRLDEQIQALELEVAQLEYLLRLSEEMRRRDEEREASGVGLSQPSWDEMETEREIESKREQMAVLKARRQESEEKARRFQQQAEQIDVELKGRLEDD